LVRARGEPFRFGIEAGSVSAFLEARGLECVAELRPDDFESIYLQRGDGTGLGRVVGYRSIAQARRPAS
jgi:hypothetical protein